MLTINYSQYIIRRMEKNTRTKCGKCKNYIQKYDSVGFCIVRNTYVDSGSVHYPDKCREVEALELLNMAMDLWYKRKKILIEERIEREKLLKEKKDNENL